MDCTAIAGRIKFGAIGECSGVMNRDSVALFREVDAIAGLRISAVKTKDSGVYSGSLLGYAHDGLDGDKETICWCGRIEFGGWMTCEFQG